MSFDLTDLQVGDEVEASPHELGVIISAIHAQGGSFTYVGNSLVITFLPNKPELKTDPMPEPKPEPIIDPMPQPMPDPTPDPMPQFKTEPKPAPKPEAKPAPKFTKK